jgi:hypothetical protein
MHADEVPGDGGIASCCQGAVSGWPELGVVLSLVKSWVLAMLASQRELRVAPIPLRAANLTGPARDADEMGRPGRRNRVL